MYVYDARTLPEKLLPTGNYSLHFFLQERMTVNSRVREGLFKTEIK